MLLVSRDAMRHTRRRRGTTTMADEKCPECGCRWDDHRTELQCYESDDPSDLAYMRSDGFDGSFVTCTNCADCYEYQPVKEKTA